MEMKKGWPTKTFGEVLEIRNGRNQREVESVDGEFPIYGSAGNVMGMATDYICEAGTTIIGRKGNINSPIYADTRFWNVDTAFGLSAKAALDSRFLYFFCLSYDFSAHNRGTTIPSLVKSELLNISIPVPPLAEQQRIVGLLDEAFEGLATAKANAQKNLQNARALFESHLHVEHAEKAMLGDLVHIKTGKLDANAAVEGGKFPFFTCSRDIFAIDTYAFDCEAILLAGNNAVGDFNVKHYNGKFNAYQRTYVITVNEKKRVLYRFLYFQMLKSLKKFKAQSVGAGTKFLKLGMIKELEIELPSLDEQQRIVSTMDALTEQTQRLARLYERKLAALEALKKSLLHQAFTGEL
jgi:type I restriction enzyme S subunit